ncbi:MAG: hypothetical protein AB8B51_17490 [Sedimentitalea sp.]
MDFNVLFKLTFRIVGAGVDNIENVSLPFSTSPSDNETFTLRLSDVVDPTKPHPGYVCDYTRKETPPERVRATLVALREGRLLMDRNPQIDLPFPNQAEPSIDSDGMIAPGRSAPRRILPQAARVWLSKLDAQMSEVNNKFITNWRWLQRGDGSHVSVSHSGFAWSDSGAVWSKIPKDGQLFMQTNQSIHLRENDLATASKLASEAHGAYPSPFHLSR